MFRGRLLVAGERRARAAAARGRAAVGARPQPHGAGRGAETVINVPVKTLDSVLEEAGAPTHFDFLSIDVEGHEIEVLRGFTIARWRPRLILLEDHVATLAEHRHLNAAGYRIVRRLGNNGWYVPRESPVRCRMADRWEILRKYYLALPFRVLRNLSRRLRRKIMARACA